MINNKCKYKTHIIYKSKTIKENKVTLFKEVEKYVDETDIILNGEDLISRIAIYLTSYGSSHITSFTFNEGFIYISKENEYVETNIIIKYKAV